MGKDRAECYGDCSLAASVNHGATPSRTLPVKYSRKNKTIMSTSLPPILALPVPVYGKEVKANRETKLTSTFSQSTDKQGNEGKNSARTYHAGIRRHKSQLPFSKKRKTGVDQMEREKAVMPVVKIMSKKKSSSSLSPPPSKTVHVPCEELVLEATPQETKKRRKKTPHLAVGKSVTVHKYKKCKKGGIMTKAEQTRDCYRRVNPNSMWAPPESPYGLLQEDHSFDPWRVLVICMLLNQTTGAQVKKVLRRVFLVCPTAEAAANICVDELTRIISSLGLQKKRARDISEMSRQYLEDWTYVTQLHGIGKYAADAYAIFCVGKPEDVVPKDHMLVKYWDFVVQWRHEQQRIMAAVDC